MRGTLYRLRAMSQISFRDSIQRHTAYRQAEWGFRRLRTVAWKLLAFLFAVQNLALSAQAQEATAREAAVLGLPPDREAIEAQFRDRLEKIASKCDELGLIEEAAITRQWPVDRFNDRHYFFVPPSRDALRPDSSADKNLQYWYEHFLGARSEYADHLFELAKIAAGTDDARAFRLLHEVLHENPDHLAARAALGYEQHDGEWLRDRAKIRSNKATRDQKLFGWKRRTYWTVHSPHFRIDCAADREVGEELVRNAERWYSVWRQLFFNYWNRGQSVRNWIDGKSSDTGSRHKFEIVLFRDRQQYLAGLSSVEGIEISTGYYDDQQRKSFFYVDGNSAESIDTWQHELTHQWFQETIPSRDSPSEDAYAWVLEGIAMYMESLEDRQTFFSVGGVDATRLQYARLRFNRDGFFVPLESANQLGRKALQQHADVRQIYSQSAGVCHYLMSGEQRDSFIAFLKSFYEKRGGKPSLKEHLGEMVSLDRAYQTWLLPLEKEV